MATISSRREDRQPLTGTAAVQAVVSKHRRRLARLRPLFLVLLSLTIFFAIWQFLSTFVVNPHLIPPPTRVAATAIPMAQSAELFRHVPTSMIRVARKRRVWGKGVG